jgi:hypothetical protein
MSARILPLAPVTLAAAATEFLARRDLDADTIRSYAQTLTRLRRGLPDRLGRRGGADLEPAPLHAAVLHHPAAADLCPDTGRGRLSYERAEYLFKQATGGWTLHQLRHSRLHPPVAKTAGQPRC